MSGKPIELYVDNASEFKSEALRRGCEQHGIRLRYRPPGQPHFGGIIEPTGCAICVELTLPCSLGDRAALDPLGGSLPALAVPARLLVRDAKRCFCAVWCCQAN